MSQNVCITGIGLVTPLGYGWQQTWAGLCDARSGVARVRKFDPTGLATHIAGELPPGLNERFRDTCRLPFPKRYVRFTKIALLAAGYAIEDSGFDLNIEDPSRIGTAVGVGAVSFHYLISVDETLRQSGKPLESALDHNFVIKYMPNAATSQLSLWKGLQGPSCSISAACATGAQSIALAMSWIRSGKADVVVAGGADSTINRYSLHAYNQIHALSTRNNEPERASRPFDKDRDGFIMAEGSGVLVLESEAHAKKRNARVYAHLIGEATTSEAYKLVTPRPEGIGVSHSIDLALKDAGINPEQVDYLSAHGNGTKKNDANETMGIKRALGDHAYNIPVSSCKSMLGHAIGGSSAIQACITALSLHQGVVTPTINLDTPDPECDLDYVPHQARDFKGRIALSNAFGFGGHNCVLVFSRSSRPA